MRKKAVCFRPDIWLNEDVTRYANTHQLANAQGEFNWTQALHSYIRELKEKVTKISELEKNAAINKVYIERLQKEVKPFPCIPLDTKEMTLQACVQCQQSAKANPSRTPQAVLDCPRNKGA